MANARQEAYNIRKAGMHTSSSSYQLQTVPSRDALESMLKPAGEADSSEQRGKKRGREEEDDDDQAHDEVRLWEDGFKDRYYESKFDVTSDNLEFRFVCSLNVLVKLD